jgi:hypothetical protein
MSAWETKLRQGTTVSPLTGWRLNVRFWYLADIERCPLWASFRIYPKVLNSCEDAHLKTMSTFETGEHLQA